MLKLGFQLEIALTLFYYSNSKNIKVFFIREDHPNHMYLQFESVGKKFLNRFVMDESDQFEIYGVYNVVFVEKMSIHNWNVINDAVENYMRNRQQGGVAHFIWTEATQRDWIDSIIKCFKSAMARNNLKSALLTFIYMRKVKCITREEFLEKYKVDVVSSEDKIKTKEKVRV